MKIKKWKACTLLLWAGTTACTPNTPKADAYGNFEATEILVSSEADGKLIQFTVQEGETLKANQLVGVVDTIPLYLQKQQLKARISSVTEKTRDIPSQISVYREKKKNLLREKKRVKALLKDQAATTKQLDDIEGEIDVINQQLMAVQTQLQNANRGILGEIDPIEIQIQRIEDQLKKCYIKNPHQGTVLTKMAEQTEITSFGKPLYKLADLEKMTLKVYVSGQQLSALKIGQEAEVWVDNAKGGHRKLKGRINWIASEAEFTPKIIQTKEERVALVYAVKVLVKNDGRLKIGMPAEVNF